MSPNVPINRFNEHSIKCSKFKSPAFCFLVVVNTRYSTTIFVSLQIFSKTTHCRFRVNFGKEQLIKSFVRDFFVLSMAVPCGAEQQCAT